MKFQSIQILRALAANLVVLFHLIGIQERFYPDLATLTAATSFLGPAGVHCFFVISGFVVTRVAMASGDWRRFLFARFTRIYPIYWFYLCLMIVFYAVRSEPVTPDAIIKSIALWPEPAPKILPVAWSLVYEVYFYIVIALSVLLRARMPIVLGLWAAIILLANAVWPDIKQAAEPILFVLTGPFTLEFIAGGFAGLFASKRFAIPALIAGAVYFVFGALAFQVSPQGRWSVVLLLGFPFVPIVYGMAAAEMRFSPRYPKLLVWLGDASYSTYLSHILVIAIAGRGLFWILPHSPTFSTIAIIACGVLANLWGMASYWTLEKPIMRLHKRFRADRLSAEPVALR